VSVWGSEPFHGLTWEQAMFEATQREARLLPPGRFASFTIAGEFKSLQTARVTLQDQGGNTVYATVAAPVELVSTSAADTIVGPGTGAHIVLVRGLGEDFTSGNPAAIWLDELVVMLGTTPVQTVNSFIRIVSMRVVISGTDETNVGDIDASIGGNIQLRIGTDGLTPSTGNGVSKAMAITVPGDWTGYIRCIDLGWSGQNPAQFWFGAKLLGTKTYGVTKQISADSSIDVGIVGLPSGLDIFAQAAATTGGTFNADGLVMMLLVRNIV
jgi:hypothetical protein